MRRPYVLLQDIGKAIARLESIGARGEAAFRSSLDAQDAAIYQITIIGEAAGDIPND